jgi:hypothetical protein
MSSESPEPLAGRLGALNALPTTPYSYAEWKRARVAPDYHIEVADHYYYSVPYLGVMEISTAAPGPM